MNTHCNLTFLICTSDEEMAFYCCFQVSPLCQNFKNATRYWIFLAQLTQIKDGVNKSTRTIKTDIHGKVN